MVWQAQRAHTHTHTVAHRPPVCAFRTPCRTHCTVRAVPLTRRAARTVFAACRYADTLHAELAKECENGRLLRLLAKLNHITDRQSLHNDPQWGEHSDHHLLRLYRDSLFHLQDEVRAPGGTRSSGTSACALSVCSIGSWAHGRGPCMLSPCA